MKSSKFFIKSNYIKNTKNDWVYCDGKLLYHQNITFLHLKTDNFDKNTDTETGSQCSGFSTLSQLYQSKIRGPRLNVLCNLCQFKSCEIKSVNFKSVFKFAIKLVPCGFLRSKKLLLLPDMEDSLTEWCGILTGFISKTGNVAIFDSADDDKSAMTISSTLRIATMTEKSSPLQDVYISLDENDAYDSTAQEEFYLVTMEPTADSLKLNVKGNYIMKLGQHSLELLDVSSRESVHVFPYSSIRRFGAKENLFRVEAGRRCTTGNGSFIFRVKDAVCIAEKLKNNTRQKVLAQNSTHSSCMTLVRPSSAEISLQISPRAKSTLNLKGRQSMDMFPRNTLKLPEKASISRTSAYKEMCSSMRASNFVYQNEKEIEGNPSFVTAQRSLIAPEIIPRTRHLQNKEKRSDIVSKTSNPVEIIKETCTDNTMTREHPIATDSLKDLNVESISSLVTSKRPCEFEITPEIIPRTKIKEEQLEMQSSNGMPLSTDSSTVKGNSYEDDCTLTVTNISKYPNNSEFEIKEYQEIEEIVLSTDQTDLKSNDIFQEKESETTVPEEKVLKSNDICRETLIEKKENLTEDSPSVNVSNASLHDRDSLIPELLNCKSDESINSSQVFDSDQRPTSLFDNSSPQILTSSASGSTDSPTFNSLPFPDKSVTEEFKTSESTFFKYRKLPKPPIRTAFSLSPDPPVVTATSSTANAQAVPPNLDRSDSIQSVKKSPPPTLPKPKFKVSQDSFDQSSFREFDQMLKNLNLSFC